ncbi:TNF receptor-associated factor 1-like [Glandiceps talaboti]
MSIYLVVMQGDYDDLLEWPFTQKVTFTLIDQENGENIQEVHQPKNAVEGRRPSKDDAIAYGSPLFVKLSQFNDNIDRFVKDDMFVKIKVDTTGL